MEMYFRYCDACDCFEYDCHGLEGCITNEPGYKGAHARHRARLLRATLEKMHQVGELRQKDSQLRQMRILDHRFHQHDRDNFCFGH